MRLILALLGVAVLLLAAAITFGLIAFVPGTPAVEQATSHPGGVGPATERKTEATTTLPVDKTINETAPAQ